MDVVRQTLSVCWFSSCWGSRYGPAARRRGGLVAPVRWDWGGASDRARAIETVERLSAHAANALHLVRWNGRELLVSTHAQGCTVLGECARIKDA